MAKVFDLAVMAPPPAVTSAAVMVRDLTVEADIGVNIEEIGRRQPLIIDVELEIGSPAGDRLDETVDYRQIVAIARALADQRIELIETFARLLAGACLDYPLVREAKVSIRKPRALPDAMAMTSIVMRRV